MKKIAMFIIILSIIVITSSCKVSEGEKVKDEYMKKALDLNLFYDEDFKEMVYEGYIPESFNYRGKNGFYSFKMTDGNIEYIGITNPLINQCGYKKTDDELLFISDSFLARINEDYYFSYHDRKILFSDDRIKVKYRKEDGLSCCTIMLDRCGEFIEYDYTEYDYYME